MGVFFLWSKFDFRKSSHKSDIQSPDFFSLNFRLKFSTLYHIDIIKRETWTYLITFLKSYDVYCIRWKGHGIGIVNIVIPTYSNTLGYANCELFAELIEYICAYHSVWISVTEKLKLTMFTLQYKLQY